MSLLSVEEVRAQIPTGLSDAQIQAVIDREEAAVVRLYGPHYTGEELVEVLAGGGRALLFLPRRLQSVTALEVWNGSDWEPVDTSLYYVWPESGIIENLAGTWPERVRVTYVPADDSEERKAVILELVRLALSREALSSGSVGGDYSFTSPDWEKERARIMRRLKLGV